MSDAHEPPRLDQACTRDLGFIVTDGDRFFSEEKRSTRSKIATIEPGVPAYRLVNTCAQARYRLEKEIVADPRRDALLQRVRFVPLAGATADYRLHGESFWDGIQLDETAFPILLVDLARRHGGLHADEVHRFWPMVLRAAGFLVRVGPVTQQDRWEEDPGYSPFTLAVVIAAFLAASDLAELHGERSTATYLRETADAWNASIERWIYVTGTALAQQVGVDGYYVRRLAHDQRQRDAPDLARSSHRRSTDVDSRPGRLHRLHVLLA
jgi:GH15 family glucan-1,4-alpha-glucosidase